MDDLFGMPVPDDQKTVDAEQAPGEVDSKDKVVSEERIERV